jgi:hypothetical protein
LILEDLYKVYQDWMNGMGREEEVRPIVYPPQIVLCKACDAEINVLEEAHLACGGFYCLKESCLKQCSAVKGISIKVKEEFLIGDRDD